MTASEQGAQHITGRWLTQNRTLIFITHEDQVLLMKRALTKRVFPGYFNGVGGHIERDEDPLSSALREVTEETGLTPDVLQAIRYRGAYNIDTGDEHGIMLYIFTMQAIHPTVTANGEGELHWVKINEALSLNLVEDLPLIWDRLFGAAASQTPFFAHVSYDTIGRMLMRFKDTEID
jgi:8-oxo-dGTP diphosphatase